MMPRFEAEVSHPGLGERKIVKGSTRVEAELKASEQVRKWDERYQRQLEREARRTAAEAKLLSIEEQKQRTEQLDADAKDAVERLKGMVKDHVHKPIFSPRSLLMPSRFDRPKPIEPQHSPLPREPKQDDDEFTPSLGLLDKLIPGRKAAKKTAASELWADAHRRWKRQVQSIKDEDGVRFAIYKSELTEWEERKSDYVSLALSRKELVTRLETAASISRPDFAVLGAYYQKRDCKLRLTDFAIGALQLYIYDRNVDAIN